jgi:hypothetical protein
MPRRRLSTGLLQNCYKMSDSKRKEVNFLRAKTISYATWVTAVLAAISFLMLALSMHHSTRSAANSDTASYNGRGYHDGDI